ncbi:glycine zipper family protein [Bartonella kosoyi]|uniref:Glycine zipper family protein n=1 Tax=Bartonella kosoyi TaxID=2133959 RepID=A0A5B9CZ17_9HYPH|nr:glycine zipper family protein [Bartonella kosoyi]QEE09407.1 glycine zipper family protein [Bartonella kosoyi]
MAPYKTSGKIHSQYVYAKNGTRFRIVEDSTEIEKIIRSHANSSSSSSPRYVYAKNGTRFRVVEDPDEIAKLSNNFVEGLQNTSDQSTTANDFSFDDKDLTWWDALRSHGASGLTAGYSDEIQAANEAGFKDYWSGDKRAEEIYNRRVAKERAYLKALEEKHPIWSSIGYIAGSLVPTGLSFVPGLGLLRIGSAASTFGNLGKAAVLGAGSGALHGSGAGEGLYGRLISAGTGGGIGAVAGPVGSLAGTAASWGTKKIGRGLQHVPFIKGGRFNPAHKEVQTKAVREVAKTLYDDGVENVTEHLASAPRHAFLTDISPNLEVSLANMGGTNARVSKLLKGAHEGRMQGAVQRLGQSADENITPLQDTKVLKRVLQEQGEKEYQPIYAQVYRTPVGKEHYAALNDLFADEAFQEAVARAVKVLKKDRRNAKPEMFYSREFRHINYKPTMALLDQTKKSLDYLSKKYYNLGDNQMAFVYKSLKKDLVEIADQISPTYKAARGSVAKYEGFEEAINQGKNIAQRDVSGEGIAEGLRKGATPSGLNTYRVGMRDYIDDLLKGSRPINNLSNILQTGSMSDNLSRSLNPKNIHAFRKAVEGERFYEDAAQRAVKPFQGTPEPNYLTGVNLPYGGVSAARAGAKITQNILSDTIRKLPQKEREILERDIAKLATFGVKGMKQQEVAQMIQRFIDWHKRGIFTEKAAHIIFSALMGEAGRFIRSKV